MNGTKKTAVGLDENLAAALAYGLGWITGGALLLVEHENTFVRFHAMQSAITFGALSVLWFVGLSIPIFGWILSFMVIPVVSVVIWLMMLFKSYHGERYKLPIAGDLAERHA